MNDHASNDLAKQEDLSAGCAIPYCRCHGDWICEEHEAACQCELCEERATPSGMSAVRDPYVRQVGGDVCDLDGAWLRVGVDYDSVTIGSPLAVSFRLTRAQAEEFAQVFVAACWEAGANAKAMRQETGDG